MNDDFRRGVPPEEEYWYTPREIDESQIPEEEFWREHGEGELEMKYNGPQEIPLKYNGPQEIPLKYSGPQAIELAGEGDRSHCLQKKIGLSASVPAVASTFSSGIVEVNIPPNAAITKICASILQDPSAPIDNGYIRIYTTQGTIFAYEFYKPLNNIVGNYETSFVQPLCVGPEGAVAGLLSYRGVASTAAQILRINVLYCPDYCPQASEAPKEQA